MFQDYVDAFEKLVNLDIKGQQQREIMHILLSCCLQEKVFNPYYAALGQKFCDADRKYQVWKLLFNIIYIIIQYKTQSIICYIVFLNHNVVLYRIVFKSFRRLGCIL